MVSTYKMEHNNHTLYDVEVKII